MTAAGGERAATAARREGNRRRTLAAVASMVSVYFFSYFQRTGIPGTIFDELQAEVHLTATAVAGLGAVFLQIYAWMQLVAGVAADHVGGRRALLAGGVVMCLGAVAFPLCRSGSGLYLSRALTALGASFMYLSIVKEIDRLFAPQSFPIIMGAVLFGGYSGGIAATLPFERAVAAWGWRSSLLGVAALMTLTLGLAFAALRGLPALPRQRGRLTLGPLWEIVRNPLSRPLLVYSAICFPVYFGIQAVLGKKFLQDFARFSSAKAAVVMLVMMVTGAAMTFVGGLLLRWIGHRRKPLLIGSIALVLAALVLLLAGIYWRAGGWIFLVACVLLAASTGASPASLSSMKELNRPDVVAQAIAVSNCAAYLGVGAVAYLGGWVLDRYRGEAIATASGIVYPPQAYATYFALLLGLALVALVACCRVRETRGESLYAEVPSPGPGAPI